MLVSAGGGEAEVRFGGERVGLVIREAKGNAVESVGGVGLLTLRTGHWECVGKGAGAVSVFPALFERLYPKLKLFRLQVVGLFSFLALHFSIPLLF